MEGAAAPRRPAEKVGKSLTRRILLVFLLSNLSAALVATMVAGLPLYDQLVDREHDRLVDAAQRQAADVASYLSLARDYATHVTDQLHARDQLVGLISDSRPDIVTADLTARAQEILLASQKRPTGIVGMSRLAGDGSETLRVGVGVPEGIRAAAALPADAGGTARFGPVAIDGRLCIVVRVPTTGGNGELAGTDLVVFELAGLAAALSEPLPLTAKVETVLSLPGAQGQTLVHPEAGVMKVLADEGIVKPALALARQGRSGWQEVDDRERGVVVAYTPVAGSDWGLALTAEAAQLQAPVLGEFLRQAPMVLVGALLAGLLVALGVYGAVGRGVSRLVAAKEDELAEKTRALEAELVRRNAAERLLREQNDDLEGKIRARTVMLERTNAALLEEVERRTRSELELRRSADEARELAKVKTEFVANISHELRTPLTAILGFADLLLGAGEVQGDAARSVMRIRRNGQSLLRLVNDLLDLSRTESGAFRIQPELVDLNALLAEVESVHASVARRKGVALRFRVSDTAPRLIRSDGMRLKQVLTNLVSNALKFTDAGHVEVTCAATPPEGDDGGLVSFRVADTGCGIPADKAAEVFEPFARLAEGGKRPGTGLGLTLSRRLARALGGDVALTYTEIGKGTEFVVTVARELAPPETEDDLKTPPKDLESVAVLH